MKTFIAGCTTILCCSLFSSQVGINTTTPNNATVLDISSNEKGILIPRLSDAERDASLADNDEATVPPVGVVNTSLTAGTLIYNTTDNRFEFWDGTLWRQFFVATSSEAGNDGVVKINGGNGGAQPTFNNANGNQISPQGSGYGAEREIIFSTPLTFAASPTTSWPETVGPVGSAAVMTPFIYNNTSGTFKFIENNVEGQVHLWRVIVRATAGSNSSGSMKATLRNQDSGFEINSISVIPANSSAGNILTFYFYTIADPQSLASGRGYRIFLQSDMSITTAIVDSITRVSLFKD